MNTAEYAQPLYPSQDASTGIAVRPRRSGPDDDPLADTDARRQHVDGDGRLASRPGRFNPPAAARAITDSGQRTGTDQRDRPPADGASPEIQLLDRQLRYRGKPPRKPRQSGRQKPRKQGAPGKGRPQGRRRTARKALILGGSAIVAVLAVAAYLVLRPQPSHAVSAPTTLGSYARQQANATAEALKRRILAAAGGDVKNVVAAVYERTTGPGTSTGPQIIVFIGGNLTGNASASSLISAFMTRLHGAFTTSAGQLGGQAACAPGSNGGPAECAWADNDTFGVVVSATLTAAGLANEMRQMRSQVEHVVT